MIEDECWENMAPPLDDTPRRLAPRQPLGERKVIDASSGRALPYRNVLAELAEEYGRNGNGAGDEEAVD
jgi:hypothetical protein